jgi:hypothetical protein
MLLKYLKKITDQRRNQSKQYQLCFIVLFSILAILSGASSYRGIARFTSVKFNILKKKFRLKWKKAPAYTTIRNILLGINSEDLEQTFREYTEYLQGLDKASEIKCVAIDGKTLRGSFDHFEDKKASHILEVFCSNSYLILAHQEVGEKTNEIPGVQDLLEILDLKNYIITLDALHCQINTFRAIKKGGATV